MRKQEPPKSALFVAERRSAVIALAGDRGLTYRQIGNKVGLSESRVRAILSEEGIHRRRQRPMTEGELDRAASLIADGASVAEVARTLDRADQTINHYFKGWSRAQCGAWVAFCNRAYGHFDPFTGEATKPSVGGFRAKRGAGLS
jgi:predicted transcriptional regulator